jgi:hypothetical protein
MRGALTEIAVISFDMNVEGAGTAGATPVDGWLDALCMLSKPRSACTAPYVSAGSSVCEKVSSTIAGYVYNHDDDEFVSKYFHPLLVQPQCIGSLCTATSIWIESGEPPA